MFRRRVTSAILVFLAVAVAAVFMVMSKKSTPRPEAAHYHAGFRVYVDGQLQDYSAAKYMKIEPCTTGGYQEKEDDQAEKAHLHDGVGDVVHVHRNGAVWGDLFKNIRTNFDPSKTIAAYEEGNGTLPDIMNQPIRPHQSIVIVVGDQKHAAEYAKNAVTLEHIKDVEAKSETCGGTTGSRQ